MRKLSVENLSIAFGDLDALVNVSLDVKEGELISIIGPNGAGKTSLINCVTGFYNA